MFLNSGVPAAMLRVVPEPVDTFFYDPAITVPFDFPADLVRLGWAQASPGPLGPSQSVCRRTGAI